MEKGEKDVISLFVSPSVPKESIKKISDIVGEKYPLTELTTIETNDNFYDIVISFE